MTEPVVNTEKTTVLETKEKKSIMNIEMPPPSATKVAKRLNKKFNCTACKKSYKQQSRLKNHIRSKHFNLKSQGSNVEKKKINDTWFEKVVHTDYIAEIKKESANKLVIRRSESKEMTTD